jgi:hypothetical protein
MQFNVSRITRGEYRPLLHLFEQPITAEAVPAMLRLLDHHDVSVRRGAAALLLEQTSRLEVEERQAQRWTSWSLSRRSALAELERRRPEIHGTFAEVDDERAEATLRQMALEVNGQSEEWAY